MAGKSWKLFVIGLLAVGFIAAASSSADAWWGCHRSLCGPYYSCYTPCYTTCIAAPCRATCWDPCSVGPCGYRAWGCYRYGCGYGLTCGSCAPYPCGACWNDCGWTGIDSCCSSCGSSCGTPGCSACEAAVEVDAEPTLPGPDEGADFWRDSNSAVLTLVVPADATVRINGRETATPGETRQYVSHGLQDGFVYTYEVHVAVLRDGKVLEQTKTIQLSRGGAEQLAFDDTLAPADGMLAAK